MPLPPNASITDVINKLTELEGINQKTELASVIGSPALSTDTVAQQIVKLQDSKDLLATNLTAKGQVTANDEPIEDMANKVGQIQYSKYAEGTSTSQSATAAFTLQNNEITTAYYTFTVSGLSFKPKRIEIFRTPTAINNRTTIYFSEYAGINEFILHANLTSSASSGASTTFKNNETSAYVTDTGFRLPVRDSNVQYGWRAYGEL